MLPSNENGLIMSPCKKYKILKKINVNRASLVFDIFIPETIQTKPKYIKQTNRRNKHTLAIIYNKSEYNPKNFLEQFLEGEKDKIRNEVKNGPGPPNFGPAVTDITYVT